MGFAIDLKQRLEATEWLDHPEVVLRETEDARVIGYVASSAFVGLDQIDRQEKLWDYLGTLLGREDRERVLGVLTMTPEELNEPSTAEWGA